MGKENFEGPIIHTEKLGNSRIAANSDITKLVVLGAGKSAADVVYDGIKHGKEVHWIIRQTGTGPGFFASGRGKGPFKNSFEAAHTRVVASLGPSIFNSENIWTGFLHHTLIGRWLVNRLLTKQDQAIRNEANYQGRDKTKGFNQLEYEATSVCHLSQACETDSSSFFWQNGPGGLIHHDDFWDTISSNVYVHRNDIKSLGRNTVLLERGNELECDAIVCGTGWKPSLQFFDNGHRSKLGLPMPLDHESSDAFRLWGKLLQDADKDICSRFPLLKNPPTHPHQESDTTAYRLYRGMLPIDDGSILFMNHVNTGNKLFVAEAQAMWAVAYFDKQVALPSKDEMEKDIAKCIAFSRRRYLSTGQLGNAINFESITYVDALLKDIELSAHQKVWWKDWFQSVRPGDLGEAWAEYRQKHVSE